MMCTEVRGLDIFRRLRLGAPAVYLAVFCLIQLPFLSVIRGGSAVFCIAFLAVSAVSAYCLGRFIPFGKWGGVVLRMLAGILLSAALGSLNAFASVNALRLPCERLLEMYGDRNGTELTARIDDTVSAGENYGMYDITVILADGKNAKELLGGHPRLRLSFYGDDFLKDGDVVSFEAQLSVPEEYTDDGFAEGQYLASHGIFGVCRAESELRLIGTQKAGFFSRLRTSMSEGLSRYIANDDASALASCLLLGERSGVSKEITAVFRASGASHILSVSGMHLSILFFVIASVLGLGRKMHRSLPLAEPISCIIAFMYMAIADFTPSIMRAGLMLIVANLFTLCVYYIRKFSSDAVLERDSEDMTDSAFVDGLGGVKALAGAAAIITVISPYSLYDVGLRLSMLSTLGIIVAAPLTILIIKREMPPLSLLESGITVTLFAVAFTFPVSAYSFRGLSSMSVAANLLLAPIITPLLVLLLFTALLSLLPSVGIITAVCTFLGALSKLLCTACIWICELLGRFEFSVIEIEPGTVFTVFCAIFAVLVPCIFIIRALDYKWVSMYLGLSTVALYLIFFGISFVSAYRAHSMLGVRLHTVSQDPYFCAASRNTRIFIDCARGYYSSKHISDTLGDVLYETKNYYLLTPCLSTDFDTAYLNASLIADSHGLCAVLLPSPTVVSLQGHNANEYAELIQSLSGDGIEVAFYESELTVCGITLSVEANDRASFARIGEYSVIFDDEYRKEYAEAASMGAKHCVYFCTKAKETDNPSYNSEAQLYVTSSVHKKINGSLPLPAGKSGVLQ